MKAIENLPLSYGLGKELRLEVKGAKAAMKAFGRCSGRVSLEDDGEERRAGEIDTDVR
jgi:hypothetical protein